MRWAVPVLCLWLVAPAARADRVHLDDGAVLQGDAVVEEERVVVRTPGGSVTLARDSVVRIERAETDISRLERRRAALGPRDVAGRLRLANWCRDHGLPRRENELLREIIRLAPDHAVARARLGYVRTPSGWITRQEQRRREGWVVREGRWMPPDEAAELERAEAERRRMAIELRRAEAELAAAEAQRDAATAEAAEAGAEQQSGQKAEGPTTILYYGGAYPLDPRHRHHLDPCPGKRCGKRRRAPERPRFWLPHHRHPRDYL